MKTARLLTIALLTAAAAGCGPHIRKPNLYDPGNAATQQYDAIFFDPYPLTDVGPEVVGARPREYQVPVPEVTRSRGLQPLRATVVVPPQVGAGGAGPR